MLLITNIFKAQVIPDTASLVVAKSFLLEHYQIRTSSHAQHNVSLKFAKLRASRASRPLRALCLRALPSCVFAPYVSSRLTCFTHALYLRALRVTYARFARLFCAR